MDPVQSLQPSAAAMASDHDQPNGFVAIMHAPKRTVATMAASNHHVAALPSYMLKDPETEISTSDIQIHSIAQAFLYLGIPASTIPALVKDPLHFGIGVGIGALGGLMMATVSTNSLQQKDHTTKWLERSAAMNNLFKSILASLHTAGITTNTVASFMVSNTMEFTIFQGAIAGSVVGYEAAALLMNVVQGCTEKAPVTLPAPSPAKAPV